jgi:hypothetical protein
LPVAFRELGERICWTRMQAEAGQPLSKIVRRKDLERRFGDGVFYWGVGNAPSRAIPQLVRAAAAIDVLFSVMKSRPKQKDVAPSRVLAWRRYIDAEGMVRPLPPHVLVTSRAGSRDYHYALVCRSEVPLEVADEGPFDPGAYRNVGAIGGMVGASQVTALLERCAPDGRADYRVAMRARMTHGYWVKLVDPVEVSEAGRMVIEEGPDNEGAWLEFAAYVRSSCRSALTNMTAQPSLFTI